MNRATVDALSALADALAPAVGRGTDPAVVAHVLAWAVRPRRSLDALRRRCRDGPAPMPSGPPGEAPARALLRAAAPHVGAQDARAAVAVAEAWTAMGCRLAVVGDPGYPATLADGWPGTDPPVLLVHRGDLGAGLPTVAIVGARRATGYGTGVAAWLAESVASAGGRVVSGGAVGIDASAHRAAHQLPGATTVVLGCGHRVDYPRPHARAGGLFDEVVDHGGALVSELLPDEPPRAGQVRARNRIVAGLSDVVVVIEGGERSGALLTAGAAAERGRTVLAVPGDVRAPGSAAPHRLLQEGVAPCTGPLDLLDALRASHRGTTADHGAAGGATVAGGAAATAATDRPPGRDLPADGAPGEPTAGGGATLSALPAEVREVLVAAWPRPVRVDVLAQRSGRPVGALLGALTRARVAGELAEDATGVRLRRAPEGTVPGPRGDRDAGLDRPRAP